jgi:large subunit ribosomal protein L22
MQVFALSRNAPMSPKKVREVARVIQGRPAIAALQMMQLVPRKAARLIAATLKSAIANAENNNELSAENLIVESAVVEQGMTLKRFKAGARGTAMPRRKRRSHIRIVLSEVDSK